MKLVSTFKYEAIRQEVVNKKSMFAKDRHHIAMLVTKPAALAEALMGNNEVDY
jgi:hypothetical protein